MPVPLLLTDVELDGRARADVRVVDGSVAAVGALRRTRERLVDADGRALLPGLHDHHCHVLATAAALGSVDCGPPAVRDPGSLAAVLLAARPVGGWIRGVGYDDATAGPLDAAALDALVADVPVRIQHRSGALWVVNTRGAQALGLDATHLPGVERDAAGRPTGRLWRLDDWLRDRLGRSTPDVARVSARLAARGVTGVTDATVGLPAAAVQVIVDRGFAQRLVTLGEPHSAAVVGPRKLVVADHDLPALDDLLAEIRAARPRAVAIHCVTRAALALALAAVQQAGPLPGDRIEHAAVCPPPLARHIAAMGLTVVTQPSLVGRRGDDYLARVEANDLPHLWPYAALLEAGVRVGCSSDAPYGDPDPWTSIAAAVERRAPSGRRVAPGQAVEARTALNGFLTAPDDPGGVPRAVRPGAPADLCLLDRPLADALADPAAVGVALTLIGGTVAHDELGVAR